MNRHQREALDKETEILGAFLGDDGPDGPPPHYFEGADLSKGCTACDRLVNHPCHELNEEADDSSPLDEPIEYDPNLDPETLGIRRPKNE